eukprot:6225830-Prymnesium_polylepis.2
MMHLRRGAKRLSGPRRVDRINLAARLAVVLDRPALRRHLKRCGAIHARSGHALSATGWLRAVRVADTRRWVAGGPLTPSLCKSGYTKEA